MLTSLMGWFRVDMGIDLGTCNTLVCVRGEGIVLDEPSVVAVRKGTNQVLNGGTAVGFAAKAMLGKTPGSISAVRPLKDGVISDFQITEAMLSYFIRKVNGRARLLGPRVVIAVPSVLGFLLVPGATEARPPFTLGQVNLVAFAVVVAMTLVTTPLGVKLAHGTDPVRLKRIFAVFIIVMALNMARKALTG